MQQRLRKLTNFSSVSIAISLLLLALTVSVGRQSQTRTQRGTSSGEPGQSEIDEAQFPVVDEYNVVTKNNQERLTISSKAKRYRMGMPAISNPNITVAVTVTHWPMDFPALPVAESTTILFGEVTEATANMSEDKEAVFSDFTIKPLKVLKDTLNTVKDDSTLVTSRYGGKVRFQDGNTLLVFKSGLGMPRVGRQYLFFLEQMDVGSELVTAYEIRDDKAVPLDKGTPNFGAYNNVSKTDLINAIKQKIEKLSEARLK